MHKIFTFSILTVYGATLVVVSGKDCLVTKTSDIWCVYGCCGENKSYTPCCERPDSNSKKTSMPSFSIFFYALIIFIFLLLVVCCIGKFARLKNRQTALQRSNTYCNDRNSSQRQMIQTIQNILRESRNGQSSTEGNGIDNIDFHGSEIIISPPPYDEAIKSDPTVLPPAYEDIYTNISSTTNVNSTTRSNHIV